MNLDFNILVVEDNADDVFLLRQAFKKAGVSSRLNVAGDGVEAQAYLRGDGAYADRVAHPVPDFLLLDLNMPRLNGFELLEWIRRYPPCSQLVVHVLTASARQADVQRAYGLHANSYLTKPTRVDQLVALVAALHAWHRFISLPLQPNSGDGLSLNPRSCVTVL
jgi:CheY-like chemotaxis protein